MCWTRRIDQGNVAAESQGRSSCPNTALMVVITLVALAAIVYGSIGLHNELLTWHDVVLITGGSLALIVEGILCLVYQRGQTPQHAQEPPDPPPKKAVPPPVVDTPKPPITPRFQLVAVHAIQDCDRSTLVSGEDIRRSMREGFMTIVRDRPDKVRQTLDGGSLTHTFLTVWIGRFDKVFSLTFTRRLFATNPTFQFYEASKDVPSELNISYETVPDLDTFIDQQKQIYTLCKVVPFSSPST